MFKIFGIVLDPVQKCVLFMVLIKTIFTTFFFGNNVNRYCFDTRLQNIFTMGHSRWTALPSQLFLDSTWKIKISDYWINIMLNVSTSTNRYHALLSEGEAEN